MRRHFRPVPGQPHPQRLLGGESLPRLFAACCESAFEVELGVADPPVVDYMSSLLMRFVHVDQQRPARDPEGHPLTSLRELSDEAAKRDGRPKRRLLQRIGDLTLFWTGVYPEALPKVVALDSPDALLDLPAIGRRSYRLAAACEDDDTSKEAPLSTTATPEARPSLLQRLADEYETCRDGLFLARRQWERLAGGTP